MATIDDCKIFIADFESRNPQIERARFDDEWTTKIAALTTDPTQWEFLFEAPSGCGPYDMDHYSYYGDGEPVNRHIDAQHQISLVEIAREIAVSVRDLDGQIAYLVLEKHDGTLLLGNYIGD